MSVETVPLGILNKQKTFAWSKSENCSQSNADNFELVKYTFGAVVFGAIFNGWQLAKMKKSIPDMSLP